MRVETGSVVQPTGQERRPGRERALWLLRGRFGDLRPCRKDRVRFASEDADVGRSICARDLLVDDTVLVELKSVEELAPVHSKQLLTYLKLSGREIGLLLNFNVNVLRDGIKRLVHGHGGTCS